MSINPPQGAGSELLAEDIPLAPVQTVQLANGEFTGFRVHVPAGTTLEVKVVGVQNTANNAPSGLTAEVDDETNTTNLVSRNAKHASGDPLASVDGPVDVLFAVENDTGNQQNTSGYFGYQFS